MNARRFTVMAISQDMDNELRRGHVLISDDGEAHEVSRYNPDPWERAAKGEREDGTAAEVPDPSHDAFLENRWSVGDVVDMPCGSLIEYWHTLNAYYIRKFQV